MPKGEKRPARHAARRQATAPTFRRRRARGPPKVVPPPPPPEDDLDGSLRRALGLPPSATRGPPPEADVETSEEAPEEPGLLPEEEPAPRVRVVRAGGLSASGHLVCVSCGRILRWTLPPQTQAELTGIAQSSPEGWDVEAISVSCTGTCPACQRQRASGSA